MADNRRVGLDQKPGEPLSTVPAGQERSELRLLDPDREQGPPAIKSIQSSQRLPLATTEQTGAAPLGGDDRVRHRPLRLKQRPVWMDEPIASPDDSTAESIEHLIDPTSEYLPIAVDRVVNVGERPSQFVGQPPSTREAQRGPGQHPAVDIATKYTEVFLDQPAGLIERMNDVGRPIADGCPLFLQIGEDQLFDRGAHRLNSWLDGEDLVMPLSQQAAFQPQFVGPTVIEHQPWPRPELPGCHSEPWRSGVEIDLIEPRFCHPQQDTTTR